MMNIYSHAYTLQKKVMKSNTWKNGIMTMWTYPKSDWTTIRTKTDKILTTFDKNESHFLWNTCDLLLLKLEGSSSYPSYMNWKFNGNLGCDKIIIQKYYNQNFLEISSCYHFPWLKSVLPKSNLSFESMEPIINKSAKHLRNCCLVIVVLIFYNFLHNVIYKNKIMVPAYLLFERTPFSIVTCVW